MKNTYQAVKEQSLILLMGKLIVLFGIFIFSSFPSNTPSPETTRTQTTLVVQVARIPRKTVSYKNAFYPLQGKFNTVVIPSIFLQVWSLLKISIGKQLDLHNKQFLQYKNYLESYLSLLATSMQCELSFIS